MEESQLEFGHEHPLVLLLNLNEEASNESTESEAVDDRWRCSRCGEAILLFSGPKFRCAENKCEFYLHKQCAEAPRQMNHPFHPDHALHLLPNPPEHYTRCFCNFCGEIIGTKFVYHCSDCNVDLHIKCALFTRNYYMGMSMAHKNSGFAYGDQLQLQLQRVADPLISSESEDAKCLCCWEPLFDGDGVYYNFPEFGFNIHKKCVANELPSQLDFPFHRKHPLILQFIAQPLPPCVICHNVDTDRYGLCYCCSSCNYVIHIACRSLPSVIQDKKKATAHPHPFTLFFRQFPFTCDACGIEGNSVPYLCLQCNLLVHKNCIALPRTIKHIWHEHPIRHKYNLLETTHDNDEESRNWDCVLCLDEVNTEHGSYSCSHCGFILHVKCALRDKKAISIVELENEDEDEILPSDNLAQEDLNSFTVIETNEAGEASKIKHFCHAHHLVLADKSQDEDDDTIYCDGCTLLISDSFYYYCSQYDCEFFLHKRCAEFPKKKHEWGHFCQVLRSLISGFFFRCCRCGYVCNGFAYACDECKTCVCLNCMVSYTVTCHGHQHPLSYYLDHDGPCNACGKEVLRAHTCKRCNFALDWNCLLLPLQVQHKCDKHLLTLTSRDDNSYPRSHFCDVCEEDRIPTHWFYYCATCDNSAHPKCVLGKYPFMKPGNLYYNEKDHPHILTFVKKAYYYPKCFVCSEPCQDLAVECGESGCCYIAHWKCIAPKENLIES